jgi:hypothetical protein
MRSDRPQHADHISGEWPAYVNHTLDPATTERMDAHLAVCAACRAELASWQAVAAASREATAPDSLPPLALLDQVGTRIDVTAPVPFASTPFANVRKRWEIGRAHRGAAVRDGLDVGAAARPASNKRRLHAWQAVRCAATYFWQLTCSQLPLVPASIWLISAAVMAFGCGLAMFVAVWPTSAVAGAVVGVVAPLIAGVGIAFIYGPEADSGLELALATPTSPRLILLSRMALVIGYDLVLAFAASALLAVVTRGDVWSAIPLWIGPTLLLTALSLLLSLAVSTATAVAGAAGLWLAHVMASALTGLGAVLAIPAPLSSLWHTSPTMILAAVTLYAAAVLYVPRQQRLAGPRDGSNG